MSEDKAATVFCFTPQRVTLAGLETLRSEDTARSSAPLPTVACSAPAVPEGPCPVCPRLAQEFEPFRQAAFWKSMHQKAKERERLLQQENQQLQARIRYLEQQLFGRKSESASASSTTPASLAQTGK